MNVKTVTVTYIPAFTVSDGINNKRFDEETLNKLYENENWITNKDLTVYKNTFYLNIDIPDDLLIDLIKKDLNRNILGSYDFKKIEVKNEVIDEKTYNNEKTKYNPILLCKTSNELEKVITKNLELKFKSDKYYYNLNNFLNASEFISKCLKNVNKQLYRKNKQFEKYFELYHKKIKFYKRNHEYRQKIEEKLRKLNEERMNLIDIKQDLRYLSDFYKNKNYMKKLEDNIKENEKMLENIQKIKEFKKDVRIGVMIDVNEKEIEKFEKRINVNLEKRKKAYEERKQRELEKVNKELDSKTKEYLKKRILNKDKQKGLER